MGCTHCMIDADGRGAHMTADTFLDALLFALRTDETALITGGEPTEHPLCCEFVEWARAAGLGVALASNGMFLDDAELTRRVLDLGVDVQIANDTRYYPRRIRHVKHPRLLYTYRITTLVSLGRASNMVGTRLAPNCFNLRSATRTLGSVTAAIQYLRLNGKFCTPTVEYDGSVRAGETNGCFAIGTVRSTDRDLTDRLLAHDCSACGLARNLSARHRRAIGLR